MIRFSDGFSGNAWTGKVISVILLLIKAREVYAMLSVKLPEELESRLNNLAAKTKRSKSFYMREALERYLEEYEEGLLALDRLNDRNAEYLSHEEAKKYLDQ